MCRPAPPAGPEGLHAITPVPLPSHVGPCSRVGNSYHGIHPIIRHRVRGTSLYSTAPPLPHSSARRGLLLMDRPGHRQRHEPTAHVGNRKRQWAHLTEEALDPATSKWLERVRSSSKNCGEINEKHGRLLAACLYRLALLSAGALEIGTFYGCGSTLVIAKGLMDSNSSSAHLWTVESMETRAAFAQRFVTSQSLPVTVINGIGAPAHMILPRDDLLRYLPNGQAERGSLAAFQGWHDGEKKFADLIAAAGKAASIRRLCAVDDRNIELAFLDGAEMYGLADLHEVLALLSQGALHCHGRCEDV